MGGKKAWGKKPPAQIQAIIDNALDAVVMMDSSGRITFWNPQAEKIFGWSKKEVIGRKMSETIIPEKYRVAHEKGLKRFLETGEGSVLNKRLELTALHREGHEFPVELTVTPTPAENAYQFSAFIRDITERKKAEEDLKKANEELVRLNRIKSEFTSMVSHELRTPLNIIKEGIDIVFDGLDGPLTPSQRETLDIAKNNVDRLGRLINNVLDYSRLEAGKIELALRKTNLNEVVGEVCHFFRRVVDKTAIDFVLHLPEKTVFGLCDADQVKQVLINLVNNSLKFTERGKIILRLSSTADEARIDVEDTGRGIPEEDQQKVFEMFTQAPYRGMWKTGGSGVGLAVCKLIMELHHGKITVESEVGKGSRFAVFFPLGAVS
ncbi:MAG: PAS domain-containing sensor histidine kinase [Deltaproteobacteria bacterium]|nr:PAS domain-containing sensor histidine kinase [Deltaproteobacteria bacterium]